jgi:hypothetical protein
VPLVRKIRCRVDDHFRIGSNTKTMTSTVILQLVQEGKLSLDDPIGKYIQGVPNGDQITIAQLSEIRSGLFSYSFDPGFNQTLDEQPQKVRMDSLQPTDPSNPSATSCGLGIAQIGPLLGHDGQIPGYMTFMGHDPKSGLTIVMGTNLATVPSGEGSALTILKGLLPIFYPGMAVPGGDPAAAPGAASTAPTTTSG